MKVPESHKLKMVLKDPKLTWAIKYEWDIYECDCKNHLMVFASDGSDGCMLVCMLKVPPKKELPNAKAKMGQ